MPAKKKGTARADENAAEILCKRIVFHLAGVDGWVPCQRCGAAPATDWAHIIPRLRAPTRCVEDNTWALCRNPCHSTVDAWVEEKLALVDRTIGRDRYDELRSMAAVTLADRNTSSVAFWRAERARLTERCLELGLDTRLRLPA